MGTSSPIQNLFMLRSAPGLKILAFTGFVGYWVFLYDVDIPNPHTHVTSAAQLLLWSAQLFSPYLRHVFKIYLTRNHQL
jgi:hypothetical protein